MIEKRLVQWYAADAGVDLDIAEREIVLTYVLRILADRDLLAQLALKGTAIRKLILGGQGLPEAHYEWSDLRRLIRRGAAISPDEIIRGVQQGYAFLGQLTEEESLLAGDPYGRQRQLHERLIDELGRL